jgi:hypothetical protein
MSDELKETIIREHPGRYLARARTGAPLDAVTADGLLCGRRRG